MNREAVSAYSDKFNFLVSETTAIVFLTEDKPELSTYVSRDSPPLPNRSGSKQLAMSLYLASVRASPGSWLLSTAARCGRPSGACLGLGKPRCLDQGC